MKTAEWKVLTIFVTSRKWSEPAEADLKTLESRAASTEKKRIKQSALPAQEQAKGDNNE